MTRHARSNKLCVLCRTNQSSRTGEHVWPSWYLNDWDTRPRQFATWSFNGEPILNRQDTPVSPRERVRVLLPVCISCNGVLEQRFEGPTKGVLRRLFDPAGPASLVLTAPEVRLVGEWFAKTLLLLSHPDAEYQIPQIEQQAVRFTPDYVPDAVFYDWLIDGNPPPAGLSVWTHRADLTSDERPDFLIPLPDVTADGGTHRFVAFTVAMHGLSITLVVHPGWPIEHPLEAAHQAARLVPDPGHAADLSAMPVLAPHSVRWSKVHVTLKPGVLGTATLPPLRASQMPFQFLPEISPLWESWGA